MNNVLIKDAHVARDSNHDILSDIDLHQNKELVERAEDITNRAQIDPFITVKAEQVLFVTCLLRAVNDEIADSHCQNWKSAESKVGNEETLWLLHKHLFVVSETIWAGWRQIVPVDHVASAMKDHIVKLVN